MRAMIAIHTCFETLWLGGGSQTCVTPDFCTAHAKMHKEEHSHWALSVDHLQFCAPLLKCRGRITYEILQQRSPWSNV